LRRRGTVSDLRLRTSSRLLLDSNSIIYYMDNVAPYADVLEPLFRRVQARQAAMVVSVVTESETLVLPMRTNNGPALQKFEDLFSEDGIRVVPVDRAIARRAAGVRANYPSLPLPDAMIVATAIHYGCDLIVGNDYKWKMIKDIPYLYLDDFINS
jgi:predicted nucleic acid-binding protein